MYSLATSQVWERVVKAIVLLCIPVITKLSNIEIKYFTNILAGQKVLQVCQILSSYLHNSFPAVIKMFVRIQFTYTDNNELR